MFRRSTRPIRLDASASVVALLASALLTAGGCDHDTGVLRPNQAPGVAITGGIVHVGTERGVRDSVSYTAEILWSGWDADGIVSHYEYAIDVPEDLLDRIHDPEDSGIAWRDTTAFRASFVFRTLEQDSLLGEPIQRFRGNHTFHVRSVDNQGLKSRADYVAFTAVNFSPRTTITSPPSAITADVISVGRTFNVCWEGLDPDSPDPRHLPAFYEWKLKQMPPEWPPGQRDVQYAVDVEAADVPWIRMSADTTCLHLTLQTGHPYIFAVRAVDEAGAVETRFVKGVNALILDALASNPGTPELVVVSPQLGMAVFPGPARELEVAVGTCLYFDLTGDASAYGGLVQGFNWGLDVDPDSDEGYYGWSLDRRIGPICFDSPGVHTLVIKCRDTGGGVTTGIIIVRAIRFSFDRDVLYVDDFRRSVSQGFRDEDQDLRNRQMLAAAGLPVDDPTLFGQFDTFGPGDLQADPTILRLSDISAYRLVYWDVLGTALARNPALVTANACPSGRVLQAYLSGGGSLWVSGQTVFGAFDVAGDAECLANIAYGFGLGGDGLNFMAGDFLHDYMRLVGGAYRNIRTAQATNGLVRAEPTFEAAADGFPTLEVDREVQPGTSGINACDIMTQNTYDFTGGLDTLYSHRAALATSATNHKPNAFRYRDPDPVPGQGPLAVFGFPMFFLQQGSTAEHTGTFEAARLLVAWLRSEQQRYFDTHPAPTSPRTER